MLKRAQVAERIGKSIATVRRLQRGGELNSRRDRRGVHLFDEWEVAELVERYSSGECITAARGESISTSRARVGGATRRVGDGDDREVGAKSKRTASWGDPGSAKSKRTAICCDPGRDGAAEGKAGRVLTSELSNRTSWRTGLG
jgi:hypothetical protein